MPFLRAYGVLTVTGTTAIRIPIIKRAVVDFAVSADWTPAAGDVKIAINGTAPANVANLPTAVASGNGAFWEFILTAAELTCKQCVVIVSDAATKAVEDQSFIVETFGNASAMYQADWSAANLPVNVVQINAVSTSPVTTVKAVQGLTTADTIATYTGNTPQTGDAFARLGAPVGASISADIAEVEGETDTILANTTGITFTVANQVDVNVVDWKGSAAPAMTGDAFARLGAPAGASIAADLAEIEGETDILLAGVIVTTNNDKTGYALTSGERTSVADALLDRDMSLGADTGSTTVRTVRQALRFLRNKWTIGGGTLTVKKEDDSTTSWTGAVTTTAGDPVSQIDPA